MLPYQVSNSSAGSTTQDTLKRNSLSFLPGLLKADQPLFALLSDFSFGFTIIIPLSVAFLMLIL